MQKYCQEWIYFTLQREFLLIKNGSHFTLEPMMTPCMMKIWVGKVHWTKKCQSVVLTCDDPSLVMLLTLIPSIQFSINIAIAELFAFNTEPNRAFGFPKLSYFWLFWVDFFKEYNFLLAKTHFYWCLQDYTLKIVKNVKKQLIFCFSR